MEYLIGIVVFFILSYLFNSYVERQKEITQNYNRTVEIEKVRNESKTKVNQIISKMYEVKSDLSKVKKTEIKNNQNISDFIFENERNILEKGGDQVLLQFMNVKKFLDEFKTNIEGFKNEIVNNNDLDSFSKFLRDKDWVKDSFFYYRNKTYTFNTIDLFLTEFKKEYSNRTLIFHELENVYDYLRTIGLTMMIFYLSENKVRYIEIYQHFERLGTFDRTWEKKMIIRLDEIVNKLDSVIGILSNIEISISDLIQSNQKIILELKHIGDDIKTTNLLQLLNTYETWRINRKISKIN